MLRFLPIFLSISKTVRLAVLLAALPAILLAAPTSPSPPRLPPTFRPLVSDDSGQTWSVTGTLPQPLAAAIVTIRSTLAAQGWVQMREIATPRDSSAPRILHFAKDGAEILLAVSRSSPSETSVSWGWSSR